MNKHAAENYRHLANSLNELGFNDTEVAALIRIEKSLHRWCEMECGGVNGCIERDDKTNEPIFVSRWGYTYKIRDMEASALKCLKKILADVERRTNRGMGYYYQTDPRGCTLYILRRNDGPEGANIRSCYTNGIAVRY